MSSSAALRVCERELVNDFNGLHRELSAQQFVPGPAILAVKQLLKDRGSSNILLSSEWFFAKHSEEPARLREILGDQPVRIIFYFRDYPTWVRSLYSQQTRR